MLTAYQKIMLGEKNTRTETFLDLSGSEKAVLIPLVIMIFWIGIYPKPLLDIAEPSLKAIQEIVNSYGMTLK